MPAAPGVSPLKRIVKALGSLLPGREAPPDLSRLIRGWRDDAVRSYPTVGLSPTRALSLLQSADAGHPQSQFELFDEMLQKWPRLAAVDATRRLALTGLGWELAPDATGRDRRRAKLARAVADYVEDTFNRIDRLRDALAHLATAIGYGVALAELVWENGRLVDITPVPHSRLIADPHEPWRLRVRTEEAPSEGIAVDEQPYKWLIHHPRVALGRPFSGGLLRASTLLFLAQNLSFKDWLIYSQIAGMPLRVGRFEPGTPEPDKRALLEMLTDLGSDAVAILSKNIELQLIEPARGEGPYQPLQEYCNTEVTILWLGQHLTTDIRSSGSRAAAEIHDRVREDLLVEDMAAEAQTLRRDVLRPLVQSRFGPDAPVPHFRRSLSQAVDTQQFAETLAVAVRELGLRVPASWAYRALGIPEPTDDESTLDARRLS